MAEYSPIEWTDHTFNPWVGCTKVSPACDHCYAESWAKRTGQSHLWTGERRRTTASNWQQPHIWNRRAAAAGRRERVFCASLADVFDNQVPDRWRDDLWHLIDQTPNLDWLLLTKRPQNIAKMLPTPAIGAKPWGTGWPNVWLGTTAENQEEADRRIPHLLAVPAVIRFLSIEPLLGSLDIRPWLPGDSGCVECDDGEGWGHRCERSDIPRDEQCPRRLEVLDVQEGPIGDDGVPEWIKHNKVTLDWIIAGGESGPGARPAHPDWFRSLRDQCAAADVPFFFKQWGEWTPGENLDRVSGIVQVADLDEDGLWTIDKENLASSDGHIDDEPDLYRVGKKAAGRLLDGREHNGVPLHA